MGSDANVRFRPKADIRPAHMYLIEVLIYGSAGYVCGLAVSSGVMLGLAYRTLVLGKPAWRSLAFWAVACVNVALAAMGTIFLMVLFADVSSPNYLPRAVTACIGISLGIAFVVAFTHLMNVFAKRARDGLEDPNRIFLDYVRKRT